MQMFTDNTAMHSVGRCLDFRATGPLDAAGLLQFATQVVFCDKVLVSGGGFKHDLGIAETTEHVIEDLQRAGLDDVLLLATQLSPAQWEACCMEAASNFAADAASLLAPGVVDPPGLNPERLTNSVSRIHKLISRNRSPAELEEWADEARSQGVARVVEYCIAGRSDLWEVLRSEHVRRGGWDLNTTLRLEVLVRIYVNCLIGNELEAIYSPAVPRAILCQRASNLIEETLSQIAIDAARKLAPRPLPVPALGQALVRRSKGDPSKVIETALELRDKARPLRKALSPLAEKIASGDEDGAFRLQITARELAVLLEEELHLSNRPRIIDALELKFVMGLPSPSLDMRSLVNWIEHRWKRRRVAALSDLSKTLAFRPELAREYDQLTRKVTHN